MTPIFQPKGSDNHFTIEVRHINQLVLYYYDPIAKLSRPIAMVGEGMTVSIPFLDLQGTGVVEEEPEQLVYQYPDFGFLKNYGVKTSLINRDNTFAPRQLDEIYLQSIARNFDNIKHLFESKWSRN